MHIKYLLTEPIAKDSLTIRLQLLRDIILGVFPYLL